MNIGFERLLTEYIIFTVVLPQISNLYAQIYNLSSLFLFCFVCLNRFFLLLSLTNGRFEHISRIQSFRFCVCVQHAVIPYLHTHWLQQQRKWNVSITCTHFAKRFTMAFCSFYYSTQFNIRYLGLFHCFFEWVQLHRFLRNL